MTLSIYSVDPLRKEVEAASGGRNTIIYDNAGYPNMMVVIPKFNVQDVATGLGTGVHPAFVVGGVTKDYLLIGKYLASSLDGRAMSVPNVAPAVNTAFDAAHALCVAKGDRWHMMTCAEWAAVALLSHATGTEVRGNNNYGRDYSRITEAGLRLDGGTPPSTSGTPRTYPGSGAVGWMHDQSRFGIADLNGNISEWMRGVRLFNGEIQIIADNDAADPTVDNGASSVLWRAILEDGSMVAPGTTDTLKFDATSAGGGGQPRIAKSIVNQSNGTTAAAILYRNLTAPGITVPNVLKRLGLFPHATSMFRGYLTARNGGGEKLAVRGGDWSSGEGAGIFATNFGRARSDALTTFGFRVALYP